MNCKFCNAELEEGNPICPVCGKEVSEAAEAIQAQEPEVSLQEPVAESDACAQESDVEQQNCSQESVEVPEVTELEQSDEAETQETAETAKPKKNVWKIVLTAVCGVLLLGILTVAILYGMGFDLSPRSNDIMYKDSYTVEDKAAVKAADKVVATANGKELTNGELQAHYFGGIYQFLDSYGTSYFSYNEPLDAQVFSEETGITWQQYFLEAAIGNWHRYQVLYALAQEDGFEPDLSFIETLEADLEEAAAGYGFESAEAMIQADMGPGCTVEDYVDYIELYEIGSQYVSYKFDTWEPTAEELEQFYTDNEAEFIANGCAKDSGMMASVRHILIMPDGEKTDGAYTEAQWQAALEEAEKILDEWKKGAATEESFAELANTYSEDGGSNTTGGLYENITPDSNYVEDFLNWSVDETRQTGDTGIVETEYGYHIMYYVSGEPLWLAVARDSILPYRINDMIEQNMERWPVEINYRNIIVTDVNVGE